MDRNDVDWKGYWTAPVTPFTADGAVDEGGVADVVGYAVDEGVHGILINGSTGEWFSQNDSERRRIAEVAVKEAGQRVPVVIGVTSTRASDAAELARHAASIGAAAVMASPPPMARPTPDELMAYYQEVFGASDMPAWLYNFPQDNGHPISLDQIERLADLPNVVAIKQSAPGVETLLGTIERVGDRLIVFGHLLSRLGIALLRSGYGGDGHFGSGLLLGRQMPAFFEHVWAGEYDEAGEIADRFEQLMAELLGDRVDGYNWAFGGMQPTLKAAMNLLGQPGGYPRRPKLPVDDPTALATIADVLERSGLEPVRG
ncbi:dihydrodipicolinate synthase family protein [Nocardioidaceae bacterium SCSIO 66511]|nr:dihydrodipicolinate synthase family protein [Nocardioidaceae bacterium SCSIO 66511]